MKMMKKESGFTLIELMITIIMSALILAAASSAFLGLLSQSRTQGFITASQETLVGIDILRRDIESAGTGLFWDPSTVGYAAEMAPPIAAGFGANFDDGTNGPPRAIIAQTNVFPAPDDEFDGSSYLVIKSTNVARNNASDKSTWVLPDGTTNRWTRSGGLASESYNLRNNDRVIVINARSQTSRPLVTAGTFYALYNVGGATDTISAGFWPPSTPATNSYMVYGINSTDDDDAALPLRPFHRGDYFISRNPFYGPVPSRCEPDTGVLYKVVARHDGGGTGGFTVQPLVDCVANIQIFFGVDVDGNGSFQPPPTPGAVDTYCQNLIAGVCPPLTFPVNPAQIRARIKEVRVYILAHEGRRDAGFIYPTANVLVGEAGIGGFLFPLGLPTDPLRNYRWKVYELTVKLYNLT